MQAAVEHVSELLQNLQNLRPAASHPMHLSHLSKKTPGSHTVLELERVTKPYYELPLPVTKLRSIFHFRVGAHSLPIEQGRIEVPQVPRHLRRCTFCATNAIGDERHCVVDCPRFQGLWQQHAEEEEEEIHYVHTASKGL